MERPISAIDLDLCDLYRIVAVAAHPHNNAVIAGVDALDYQGLFWRQALAELRQRIEGDNGERDDRQQ